MRIFQIGFNRCGTQTIHHYFAGNGIPSIHWDQGALARRMFFNLEQGNRLMTGYEEFVAFTDMEHLDDVQHLEGYRLFPILAAEHPDAVFILNTRDREDWVRSRLAHEAGDYAARYRRLLGIDCDHRLADVWRTQWDRHHQRVLEFFSRTRRRLVVCRIETDLPSVLGRRLPELRLDPAHYAVIDQRPGAQQERAGEDGRATRG